MAVIKKPAKSPAPAPVAAVPASKKAASKAPVSAPAEENAGSLALTPVEILDAAQAQANELQEFGRTFAQQGADSLRAAYDRTRTAAEEAAASVEGMYGKVTDGVRQMHMKAIDNLQANTLAFFDMTRSLAAAPGAAEALAIAGEHSRKQAELLAAQSKEFAELSRSVSEATFGPLAETLNKSFGPKAA